jgi:hypothetical protein
VDQHPVQSRVFKSWNSIISLHHAARLTLAYRQRHDMYVLYSNAYTALYCTMLYSTYTAANTQIQAEKLE